MSDGDGKRIARRDFIAGAARIGCLVAAGGGALELLRSARAAGRGRPTLWQIDPHKCIACGNCATYCVLSPSAVKCFRAWKICGFCDLCTAFFEVEHAARNSGAENQLCPTGAITREFVEDPYYEYTIDEELCIACGKCVKGCEAFGNGSMYLQIRHDICLNCNECSIAAACPSMAISRVPADEAYMLKDAGLHHGDTESTKNGESNRR